MSNWVILTRPLNEACYNHFMMLNSFACAGNPEFKKYVSKDAELGVSMDYVADWTASEERGANGSYAQVVFLEPVKAGKPIRALMTVTVKGEAVTGLKPASLEAMEGDLLKKRLKLKDARTLSRFQWPLLGETAAGLEFSYGLPDNPERLDAKFVGVQERVVFFKRGGRFYILRYVNTSEAFKEFDKAFTRCVHTLQFK